MGYLKEEQLKKLALTDPEYYVEIVTDLRYGDIKKFATVNHDGQVDYTASADLFLQAVIKGWNLTDAQGNALELTPENIDKLDPADATLILNEAGALVESDAEKKNSPGK